MTLMSPREPAAFPPPPAARRRRPHERTETPTPVPAIEETATDRVDTVELLPYTLLPVNNDPLVTDLHWMLVTAMRYGVLMADVARDLRMPLYLLEGWVNGTIKPDHRTIGLLRRLSRYLCGDPEQLVQDILLIRRKPPALRLVRRIGEQDA